MFLHFIGENLSKMCLLPEFEDLSECSMQALIEYEGKSSCKIVLLTAFTNWIKNKDSLSSSTKQEMINHFKLEEFSMNDVLQTVRKTNFFNDTEVCNVLENHLKKQQEEVASLTQQLKQSEDSCRRSEDSNNNMARRLKESEEQIRQNDPGCFQMLECTLHRLYF